MGTKNNQARKKHRERLMNIQKGLCFHCEKPMVLDGYNDEGYLNKTPPQNQATFEHLDDRFDRSRKMVSDLGVGRRIVLACLKCNNERGAERQATAGIDELRYRSQKLPKGAIILTEEEQIAIQHILIMHYIDKHKLTDTQIQKFLPPTTNPKDREEFPQKCNKLGIGKPCSTPSPTSSNTNLRNTDIFVGSNPTTTKPDTH